MAGLLQEYCEPECAPDVLRAATTLIASEYHKTRAELMHSFDPTADGQLVDERRLAVLSLYILLSHKPLQIAKLLGEAPADVYSDIKILKSSVSETEIGQPGDSDRPSDSSVVRLVADESQLASVSEEIFEPTGVANGLDTTRSSQDGALNDQPARVNEAQLRQQIYLVACTLLEKHRRTGGLTLPQLVQRVLEPRGITASGHHGQVWKNALIEAMMTFYGWGSE